jgi:hypothetical protein
MNVTKKPGFTVSIVKKDIIGGTFIAIGVKYRAGKIYFQEKKLSLFIHTKIQSRIAFTVKSFENELCGPSQLLLDSRVRTGILASG